MPPVPVLTAVKDDLRRVVDLSIQGRANMLTAQQSSIEASDWSGFAFSANTGFAQSPGSVREIPTIRSHRTAVGGIGTASLVIAPPNGAVAGDLLVLIVAVEGSSGIQTPSGWTLANSLQTGGTTNDTEQAVLYKTASASEGNVTVIFDLVSSACATLIAVTAGTWTGAPVVGSQSNASSGTIRAPSIVPVVTGSLFVLGGAINNTAVTTFATYGYRTSLVGQDSGSSIAQSVVYQPYGIANATPGGTGISEASTAGLNIGHAILISGVTAIAVVSGASYLHLSSLNADVSGKTVDTGRITVVPGKVYGAIFAIRALSTAVAEPKQARVVLIWYNDADAYISINYGATIGLTQGFASATVSATAPAGATGCRMRCEVVSGAMQFGEAWLLDTLGLFPTNYTTWGIGGLTTAQTFRLERSLDGGVTWSLLGAALVVPPADQYVTYSDGEVYNLQRTGSTQYRVRSEHPTDPASAYTTQDPTLGATGALITDDYQYEYRGFLFGSKTDFRTETVRGLLSMPGVRSGDTERQDDHGSFGGMDLMSSRIIDGTMWVEGVAGTDIEKKIDTLRKVFTVPRKSSKEADPFYFRRPNAGTRMAYVRCRARAIDSDYALAKGLGRCDFQLIGTDPLVYGATEKSGQVSLAAGVLSGSMSAFNEGDYADGASPVITIVGPATNPRITCSEDSNRQIKIDIVLGAADTLVIDVKRKTVFLNPAGANTDRYDAVRSDNQWFALRPGSNTITYSRASGNTGAASTMTLKHRDTYQ